MKKQLFSLVMMLAIVVLAGTSAWAQWTGVGSTPDNPDLFVVGSTGEFTVVRGEASSQLEWSLLTVDAGLPIGTTTVSAAATTAVELVDSRAATAAQLGDGQEYTTVAGAGSNTVYVKFKALPTSPNIYVLQVRELAADNNCITIRRIYLSVFDFNVDVFWNNSRVAVDTGAVQAGDIAYTDTVSWNNTVIKNTMDRAWLLASGAAGGRMQVDSVNNPFNNFYKRDSIYFGVKIELLGAPSAYTLEKLKWRFRYSMPNASNDSIYWIHPTAAPVAAATATAAPTTIALPSFMTNPLAASVTDDVEIPTESGATQGAWGGTNEVTVPAIGTGTNVTKAIYLFAIVNHIIPGGPNQAIDIRIDRAELEFDETAGTNYTSGTKVFGASDATALSDGITGTMTIMQTPATDIIQIVH